LVIKKAHVGFQGLNFMIVQQHVEFFNDVSESSWPKRSWLNINKVGKEIGFKVEESG
jgi:hypothetical protein